MTEHDFSALFDEYDQIIDQMPAIFTSHQFILRLVQQNQALYIDALGSYRGVPAPFRTVHGILARHLNAFKKHRACIRKTIRFLHDIKIGGPEGRWQGDPNCIDIEWLDRTVE